jgi:uncharacterized protein (TIGR02646 family)
MKKLNRVPLSAPTQAFLRERTEQVRAAVEPAAEAQRLWKLQDNKAFEEVRTTLKAMSTGLERCMYCEDSAATDIDHFWPKSKYPERAFSWANYLLACSGCNSNYKREQFPLDVGGASLLINPTAEDPREHLVLSVTTGKYQPRTRGDQESSKGRNSIEVFGLGRDLLEKGRKNAWVALPALLLRYGEARSRGDTSLADEVERAIREYPFASVFVWFISIASGPAAARFIDERCLAVLANYPDIKNWL